MLFPANAAPINFRIATLVQAVEKIIVKMKALGRVIETAGPKACQKKVPRKQHAG